jgi:pyrroloquinoline quinone (PQQ) biosynthesis protein C
MRVQSVHADTRPLLPPGTALRNDDDGLLVETTYKSDYTFAGGHTQALLHVLPRFDGSARIGELARETGFPERELIEVLSALATEGLIVDATAVLEATDPEEYMEAFCAIGDYWALNIFDQPFWHLVRSGNASRDVLVGWGVQFYHRVCGANIHNKIASDGATVPEIREWLTKHYWEEHDHAPIFLRGLERDGVPASHVTQRSPIPATQALIDHSIRLASTDQISYSSLDALQQSPRHGQTAELINDQFDRLVAFYPYAEGTLNAFRRHTMIDIDLNHSEIVLDKIVRRFGPPSREQTLRMLKATREIVEHFHAFFDGILRHFAVERLPNSKSD